MTNYQWNSGVYSYLGLLKFSTIHWSLETDQNWWGVTYRFVGDDAGPTITPRDAEKGTRTQSNTTRPKQSFFKEKLAASGLEPTTITVIFSHFSKKNWLPRDSNPRPSVLQATLLPSKLPRQASWLGANPAYKSHSISTWYVCIVYQNCRRWNISKYVSYLWYTK